MELRHLRCFLAVAEELHFARAAEKLHMEQSPLSRTIKELEEDLGEQLFVRTSRSTRLTRAGKLFLEHVPRVFSALQQARDSVKAAANGFHGQLRIALSDGITPSRLPALLALCRQEEPEVDIRLFQVPLAQQIKGLQDDLYDVGFAQSNEVGDGIAAEAVWNDPLMVAVPARHHCSSTSGFRWMKCCNFHWCCATRWPARAMRARSIGCCAMPTGNP
ncbi:LysR family transcriptional regulator [Enterobacter mori]